MFLFNSAPSGFHTSYISRSVLISSDALCAKHSDDDELRGVLFLDNPLQFENNIAYFQVRVEQVTKEEEDGLTLGVCLGYPSGELPECADDVENSWSLGFNGYAHLDQTDTLIQTTWNPKNLKRGDNVGFLVTSDGAACVTVNGRRQAVLPGLIPSDSTLYGFADLLGNTRGVTLLPDAVAPASVRNFSLQKAQDEAMETLCDAFSSQDPNTVQEPLLIARLLNVPESLIKSAQRALYKGPKVKVEKPKPRGFKGKIKGLISNPFGGKKKAAEVKAAEEDADPCFAEVAPKAPEATKGVYKTKKRIGGGAKTKLKMMIAMGGHKQIGEPAAATTATTPLLAASAAPQTAKERTPSMASGGSKKRASKKSLKGSSAAASPRPAAAAAAPAAAAPAAAAAAADAAAAAAASAEAQRAAEAEKAAAEAKRAGDAAAAAAAAAEAERAAAAAKVAEEQKRILGLIKDMDDALLKMNPDAVKTAVAAAKAGGVDAKEVARVEAALKDMLANKDKTEKLKALGDAVAAKDIKALQAALSTAKGAKIAANDLLPYEAALEDLQAEEARKAKMAEMEAAVQAGDIEQIKATLKDAFFVGVDPAHVKKVEQELAKLEAKKALDEAIQARDIEKIKSAIEGAKQAGVDGPSIVAGEKTIKEIELENIRKQKVKDMDSAIAEQDIEKTRSAIAAAKEAGVDAAEIKRGEEGLKKLEADLAKNLAAAALREALATDKIDAIKAALEKAKEAKCNIYDIEEAEKKLKRLIELFEEAKKNMTAAMDTAKKTNPPTVEVLQALKDASAAAAERGVDNKEAEALHASLVEALAAAKRAAEEELDAAISGKDPEVITEKVEKAQSFGSDEAIASSLEKMGNLIAEDMEKAKAVEREEKQEMLPAMEALLNVFRKFAPGNVLLRKLHNDMQDLKGALRVFCRIRPLNKREIGLNDTIVVEAKGSMDVTVVSSKGEVNAFSYDAIFVATNSQADVFEECRSLIQSCFDGYNITIFTYGQTGAGKTWTLYGIPEQPGVSPRTCTEVFEVVERFKDKFDSELSASMVELYNSNVRDLLSAESTPPKLDIKQKKNPDGSMSVQLDATVVPANSTADLEAAVGKGFGNRKVASTSMNADSSRSHLLFMIFAKVTDKETGKLRHGKITIVDLAGSERLAKSQVTGDAQKEAIEINKSLTALGDVMMAITSKAKMVPYRNHKLTQLMQDSLGGTAKTLMFVNISPASNNADETINALKYASRARSIENETGGPSGGKKGGKKK